MADIQPPVHGDQTHHRAHTHGNRCRCSQAWQDTCQHQCCQHKPKCVIRSGMQGTGQKASIQQACQRICLYFNPGKCGGHGCCPQVHSPWRRAAHQDNFSSELVRRHLACQHVSGRNIGERATLRTPVSPIRHPRGTPLVHRNAVGFVWPLQHNVLQWHWVGLPGCTRCSARHDLRQPGELPKHGERK